MLGRAGPGRASHQNAARKHPKDRARVPPAPADRAARKHCQSAGHLRAKPPDGSQKAGGSHTVVAQPLGLSWAAREPPDGKTSDATNETWAAVSLRSLLRQTGGKPSRKPRRPQQASQGGQPRREAKTGSQGGKPRRKAKVGSQGGKKRKTTPWPGGSQGGPSRPPEGRQKAAREGHRPQKATRESGSKMATARSGAARRLPESLG